MGQKYKQHSLLSLSFDVLLLLLIIISSSSWLCFCKNSTTFSACREEEREALLKIKQSLNCSNRLRSWQAGPGDDCCKWKGVGCDPASGHIIRLELLPCIENSDAYEVKCFSASALSPSLLKLKYLNHLDLSGLHLSSNNGASIAFPRFITSLKHLRHLNLSGVGFGGSIPHQLGNLTSLEFLDLSENYLQMNDPKWISHLVSLKYLDLSWLNLIVGSRELMKVLGVLPCLSHLALVGCSLHNFSPPLNSTFLANLQHLDLSLNFLGGPVPSVLRNMTSLQYLDLSYNVFNSSVPIWFGNFKSLVHLDLWANSFDSIEGGLFHLIADKCNLRSLLLSYNYDLQGETTENSTGLLCPSNVVESIEAENNNFRGRLPDWLEHLKNLRYLSLGGNKLEGPIPKSLGEELHSLQFLDLGSNQLNGSVPESIGKLSRLVHLDLSSNSLGGIIIPKAHFANLSRLLYLDLGQNQLTIESSEPSWAPPFQLTEIGMASCTVVAHQFPEWMLNQTNAMWLDLSNASIFGGMREGIGPKPEGCSVDLSHNQITGFTLLNTSSGLQNLDLDLSYNQITEFTLLNTSSGLQNLDLDLSYNQITEFTLLNSSSGVQSLHLSHNRIVRFVLNSSSIVQILDLSNNQIAELIHPSDVRILDISHNQIPGIIPPDLVESMPHLEGLYLGDNNISGSIPTSLCNLRGLDVLDLSTNKLSGVIPDCWGTATPTLIFIDLSSNNLTGPIPSSLGNLSDLFSLHLNKNSLQGEIPHSLSNLWWLEVLDLGENNLSGNLPPWTGVALPNVWALRLRENRLNGSLPREICLLQRLQILDLAKNNLDGNISHCFGSIQGMTAYQSSKNKFSYGGLQKMTEVNKGRMLEYTVNLQYVVSMDLSDNRFVGSIPEELALLNGLVSLNLSNNHLSGNIPSKIGNLTSLESLDLSNNKLSGTIPPSISDMTSLSHLNLSHNNLSGRIPRSNQLDTVYADDDSIFDSNPLLCGEPLSIKCPGDDDDQAPPSSETSGEEDGDHEEDVSEKLMFYIAVMLGFGTGLWGVIGTLMFKKSWRAAYFKFADETMDNVRVAVAVKVAKLKRRIRST